MLSVAGIKDQMVLPTWDIATADAISCGLHTESKEQQNRGSHLTLDRGENPELPMNLQPHTSEKAAPIAFFFAQLRFQAAQAVLRSSRSCPSGH